MKILVLNGSPKGTNSITLQTVLYLEKIYSNIEFEYLHVGQKIKAYEKDFSKVSDSLEKAEIILFAYPVYTFLAPAQLHRFIELMKTSNIDFTGKIASQITTSKHFYDVTAHKYIEENCLDMGMKFIKGLSSDMDDLYHKEGQQQAKMYFENLLFSIENDCFVTKKSITTKPQKALYKPEFEEVAKTKNYDIVILTNYDESDLNLQNMIADFRKVLPNKSRVVNIKNFPFSAGCLGCFKCTATGKCVHKDNFDEFLRKEIQIADAIVYAFTIKDHFTDSSMKFYDDRQFCNGHRQVTEGMQVAYLISGNYSNEPNLQMVLEGRCEVGGTYLSGIATDETDNTANEINKLAKSLIFALDNNLSRPKNFYGVGGNKIFRDLVYLMQGMMKADHKFYKEHKNYDFPQKKKGTILGIKFVGAMMRNKKISKKIGDMNKYILMPYKKVLDDVDKQTVDCKNK